VIARTSVVRRKGSATVWRSISETATHISSSSVAVSTGGAGGRELSSAAIRAIRERSSGAATRSVRVVGTVSAGAEEPTELLSERPAAARR
jgi:hypothetical protein